MTAPVKRCCTCHRDQPLTSFNRRAASADGLQPRCRECSSAWYLANRDSHRANVRERNERVRKEHHQRLGDYLSTHPCVDCGESDVRCLEFDHRDPLTKVSEVTRMIALRLTWATVLTEIEKCDVRCANCHRRRTAEGAGWWRHQVQQRTEAARAEATLTRLELVLQRPSA
jgi:hypothetical protein